MRALLQKLVTKPLVRVSLTVSLNLLIVVTVIAWLWSNQKRFDGEWQWRLWMACVYVDHNGYYVSVLPPQNGLNTLFSQSVQIRPNDRPEQTGIESNLTLEKRSLMLPGLAFWLSTRPTDPFDRIVVRLRHGLMFTVAIMVRLLLLRFVQDSSRRRSKIRESVPTP